MFQNYINYYFEALTTNTFIYLILVVPAFLIFWIFFKSHFLSIKIQPISTDITKQITTDKRQKRNFIHDAIFSASTLLIFSLLDSVFFLLTKLNLTQIYFDINQQSFWWFLISIPILIILHDAYFYWTHRLMHHPKLFRLFHRTHHVSTDPSPWTSFAFSPLESLVTHGFSLIFFVVPFNFGAIIIWQIWQMLFNVIGHLSFEIYPKWWLKNPLTRLKVPSTHHNMHHQKFNGNYGLYFSWWDKWMKTEFVDYEKRFDEVFLKQRIEISNY